MRDAGKASRGRTSRDRDETSPTALCVKLHLFEREAVSFANKLRHGLEWR